MTKFDDEIKEVDFCMYCGHQLKKEEGKPIKFCPEGCVEILFVPQSVVPPEKKSDKRKTKKDEEESIEILRKNVFKFMEDNKINNRRFDVPHCREGMIS